MSHISQAENSVTSDFADTHAPISAQPGAASPQSVRRVRQRIQLRIPSKYAQEPIVSTLATRYDLEVNIQSALMASNAQESGWFDLELHGLPQRVQESLDYLAQLHVEIWSSDRPSGSTWSFD